MNKKDFMNNKVSQLISYSLVRFSHSLNWHFYIYILVTTTRQQKIKTKIKKVIKTYFILTCFWEIDSNIFFLLRKGLIDYNICNNYKLQSQESGYPMISSKLFDTLHSPNGITQFDTYLHIK